MQPIPIDPRPSPPQPGALLVIDRWNSWVRVLEPVSGVTQWVDLADSEYEMVPGHPSST